MFSHSTSPPPRRRSDDDQLLIAAGYPTVAEQEKISAELVAAEARGVRLGLESEARRLMDAAWADAMRPNKVPYWQAVWADPNATAGQRTAALWILTEQQRRYAEKGKFVSGVPAESHTRTVTCVECGEPFQAQRKSSRYCKDKCRVRAYRNRARNAKVAARVSHTGEPSDRQYGPAIPGSVNALSVTSTRREVAG